MLRTAKKSGFSDFLEGVCEVINAMAEVSAEERRKDEARRQFMARSAGDVDQMRFELMQFKNELMKLQTQDSWKMSSEERVKLMDKKNEIQKMIRMYEQALRSSPPAPSTPRLEFYGSRTEKLKAELFELEKEYARLEANYVTRGSEGDKRANEVRSMIKVYEAELRK